MQMHLSKLEQDHAAGLSKLEQDHAAATKGGGVPAHHGAHPHVYAEKNEKVEPVLWFLNLCATFLLEVMGGCGAIWGASDAAMLRVGSDNNNTWCNS